MVDLFLYGFQNVLQPVNILAMIVGMLIGLLIGILPGLGGTMAVALIIPFTFNMEPITGILIMLSLYCTATYAGSITAILFKIPGEAPAIMTILDGHEMAKKGQAGKALGTAIFASTLGGIISTILLAAVSIPLSTVAIEFGDAEYFAMAVMGLSVCSGIGGKSVLKNIMAAAMGLFLATFGTSSISGTQRFTFGYSGLLMGITFIPAVIGLFAISEVFEQVEKGLKEGRREGYKKQEKVRIGMPSWKEIKYLKWTFLRSGLIGTIIGILPGVGATTAAFFGYSEAVRWSKHPEKFGTGIIEGIAAPEAANNAATGGAMVPLLTLGIPGSAVTAVMIGAFMIHGLRPGPMMMLQQPKLVYSIFAGFFFSNLLIILAGIIGIKFVARLMDFPYYKVGPAILLFAVIGSYAMNNSMSDVYVTLAFGFFGYVMKRYGFGLAPLILGMILGDLAEVSLRRAMLLSNFDPTILITRPISAGFLIFSALSLCYPLIQKYLLKNKGKEALASS
ncbi:MAG: tripartite tricarboxylate transporter permease [Thermodesulfobacteriota bacterium]|nr:tripartite tricarboxylate transporter permease [Thermodesulfobacteriota bacterium]